VLSDEPSHAGGREDKLQRLVVKAVPPVTVPHVAGTSVLVGGLVVVETNAEHGGLHGLEGGYQDAVTWIGSGERRGKGKRLVRPGSH
jgi:hypothetical protein